MAVLHTPAVPVRTGLGLTTGSYPWSAYQERNLDVLLVGAPLAEIDAVLALLPAVVRAKEDVGVTQLALVFEFVYHPGHEIVDRL